jgi:hypothetical protein
VTETPNDLRDAIRTALAATPAKHTQGHARPWDTHGTEHRYDATCALCRGEDDTLTDAVVTVVAEHLADARRLAARIHGIAKHPSFAAPADLAQALHEHATQLLAALGTGGGPGGAESNADGRTGPVATDAAPEPGREAQRGAEAVPLSVCGKHSKPGLGGILGPCIKAQGHPGTGDWHLDARGAAWDPTTDADAGR